MAAKESKPITKVLRWGFLIFFCVLSCYLSLSPPAGSEGESKNQQEKKEYLTSEELLKTEGGRLFVVRKFEEALKEFKKLEKEYPKDIVIKRYMGACLDHLGRDEEAIAQFKKVIQLNPNDFPSRKFLSKIYMRRGQIDLAEPELKFLVENDKVGMFAPEARAQLENIKRLREAEIKIVQAPGKKMKPSEFLETKAAQHFMNARYEEALSELRKLAETYRDDPLITRYQALALDKLGRLDEAVETLQSGLAVAPDNIALHYFLAQTFLHQANYEAAKKEYEYVVANDESEAYRIRAKADLKAVDGIIDNARRAKKRWTVDLSGKMEWMRNPGSSSRHAGFRSGRQIYSAGKFSNGVGFTYRLFKTGPWTGKASYNYSHGFYMRSFSNLNTIQNSWGGNITYSRLLFGKPLTIDTGHTIAHTMLREQYYTTSFTQAASAIYSYFDWQRAVFSEKWGFTTYDGDGTNPDMTSRDGFNNTAGVTHYFYLNKKKSVYSLVGFEYNYDSTQGANYHKDEFSYRTALHFPLIERAELDLTFKFKDTNYPKFGFPLSSPGRRDSNYNFAVTLSRSFAKTWTAKAVYDYTNVKSRDDTYTYINYGFSLSLAYAY